MLTLELTMRQAAALRSACGHVGGSNRNDPDTPRGACTSVYLALRDAGVPSVSEFTDAQPVGTVRMPGSFAR